MKLRIEECCRRLPVRTRLVIVMTGMGLLVLLLAGVAFWQSSQAVVEQLTRDRMETIERAIRKDLVAALLDDRVENIARINRLLGSFEDVEQARVYDAEGRVRFGYVREGVSASTVQFDPARVGEIDIERGSAIGWRRLTYRERPFGYLVIRFSLARQLAYLERFRWLLFLLLPALFLISLLVAVRLQRAFSAPIEELAGTFRRVQDEGDYSIRLSTRERNEIGTLYEGFNAMLGMMSETRDALAETGSRLQAILASIRDSILVTDCEGRIRYANPAALEFLDRDLSELTDRQVKDVLHLRTGEGEDVTGRLLSEVLEHQRPVSGSEEILFLELDGRQCPVSLSAAPVVQEDRPTGAVLVLRDMHECWSLARELSWQARHDSLTGLINRAEFERQLDLALENVRPSSPHVLLYLDLDQFKVVNDTCGHLAGDDLLRQLASILDKKLRDEDLFARLGGDEFAVLLQSCDLRTAWDIAERLRSAVSKFRFVWDRHTFDLAVSIGMVVIDSPEMTRRDVLAAADMACYAAKDSGRNRIHLYQGSQADSQRHYGEVQWVSRIVQALEKDRFELFMQRIARTVAADERDDALHFEVLVRMRDESGNLIPPGSFLPAAERFGSAPGIDRWVLWHVLERLASWPQDGFAMCAINLSGHTVADPAFLEYVKEAIGTFGVPADRLCFEITETVAVSDLARAREFIEACRDMGCRFALDDFGSGMSSFGYLKNLPVDFLKIDGMFVRDLVNDRIDEAMVRSINEIGHVMGMQTIAEFVETPMTRERLVRMGVDWVQGHAIHVPEPLPSRPGGRVILWPGRRPIP
ncbi:MAG TPA: EAL domain-containing protein [Thiotrichales bacterium]|nr:EAL domain-containing protein [Thiotrichales bacterium]